MSGTCHQRSRAAAPGRPTLSPEGSSVDFTVLGSLSAQDGSRAVDLGGPRQRAELGLLLIARGSIVPADRIVDDLWRGEPPPPGKGAPQGFVVHIRRRPPPHPRPPTPPPILLTRPPPDAPPRLQAGG